jgi:hypothetical protein
MRAVRTLFTLLTCVWLSPLLAAESDKPVMDLVNAEITGDVEQITGNGGHAEGNVVVHATQTGAAGDTIIDATGDKATARWLSGGAKPDNAAKDDSAGKLKIDRLWMSGHVHLVLVQKTDRIDVIAAKAGKPEEKRHVVGVRRTTADVDRLRFRGPEQLLELFNDHDQPVVAHVVDTVVTTGSDGVAKTDEDHLDLTARHGELDVDLTDSAKEPEGWPKEAPAGKPGA